MTSRCSRFAVLLVAAIALLALSAAHQNGNAHGSVRRDGDRRAVVLQPPWVDPLAVGLSGVDRRETERSGKHRVLLAVGAALVVLVVFGRRVIAIAHSIAIPLSWWSQGNARAPPSFRV